MRRSTSLRHGSGPLAWALLLGAGVPLLVLLLTGAPPIEVVARLYHGALGSWTRFAHVVRAWIPLTLCACGLLFTFRSGLWNIGVEGQVMFGALGATAVLRFGGGAAGSALLWLSILAAMLSGGLWAVLAGLLKTRGGVNEIFAGLGLNFVAQGLVLWLIFGPWRRPGVASMSGTEPFQPELWLSVAKHWKISPAGFGLAVTALVVTAFLLRYTRFGLHLKAIGGNPRAAVLFGIAPGRTMVCAMLLAGGLAGLAGAFQVTGVYHRLIPSISSGYGYLALLVAMLANYRTRWTPLVALFFAALNVGSIQLPMTLSLDSSLAGVIQGALVLAALCVGARRQRSGPSVPPENTDG